jgi:nucleotide-binding universal stress UspA family protein
MAPSRVRIRRILCPVDFSAYSTQALARACDIAAWFEAQVTVLHVCPNLFPGGPEAPCLPASAATMRALREQGKEELIRLAEPFRGRGVALSTEVCEGDPWRAILEQAVALPADLVVMGTHGRTGFEHLLLGSVTEKVLRRATCPVLTVGSPAPVPAPALFRRILCAVDLSEHSRQTIDTALAFGLESGAAVTLLHVVNTPPGPAVNGLFRPLPPLDARRAERETEALERLRSLAPGEGRDWCQLNEQASTGTPWREILAVADERKADLVVMGAHGQGPFGERLFGSTTSQVVRRSACPVLVVRRVAEPVASAEPAPAREKAQLKPRKRELVAS